MGVSTEHWTKPKVLAVLFWSKVVAAALVGTVCGLLPLTGWIPCAVYGGCAYALPYLIYNSVLQLEDPEEMGGHRELLNEGQPPGLAMFLLTWILAYSMAHT